MRADLRRAIKEGNRTTAAALRSALAAIENAEAVEDVPTDSPWQGSEHVAGALLGLGSAERARRTLSDEEMTSILRAEREQHLEAARQAGAAGRDELASRHRQQAKALEGYLAGS